MQRGFDIVRNTIGCRIFRFYGTEKQRVIHPKELTVRGVALKVIKDIV